MKSLLIGALVVAGLSGLSTLAEAKSCVALQVKVKYACGVVEDDQGAVIPNAVILVYESLGTATANSEPIVSVKTDVRGRFAIPELRPGNYYVIASYRPYDNVHFYLAVRKKTKQPDCKAYLRIVMNIFCGRSIEIKG